MVAIVWISPTALADSSLQLKPLAYQQTLKKGEKKKGFIDVTNPSASAVDVHFSVQGFRQIDSHGNLAFYPNDQLSQGILLDYGHSVIPAEKTLRLYFVIDGTKLPTGDVFAAIFTQTKATNGMSVAPSVRLGSLLILTNGTPGARQADVTALDLPWLTIGTAIRGEIAIKNTAPASSASGFFPQVQLSMWPFGPRKNIQGPLIFAGMTRSVSFQLPDNQFGVYKITATVGTNHTSRWIVVITGIWRWIAIGITVLIISIILWLCRPRRRKLSFKR